MLGLLPLSDLHGGNANVYLMSLELKNNVVQNMNLKISSETLYDIKMFGGRKFTKQVKPEIIELEQVRVKK